MLLAKDFQRPRLLILIVFSKIRFVSASTSGQRCQACCPTAPAAAPSRLRRSVAPPRVGLGLSDREVGFCEGPRIGAVLLALIAPTLREGSRRGPVTEWETTRTIGDARERKHPVHGPDRSIAAGHRTCSRNLAKVGVAGSNPVVRSRKIVSEQRRCGPPALGASFSGRSTNEKPTKRRPARLLVCELSHRCGFRAGRRALSPLG
jgi:hypothetical protein